MFENRFSMSFPFENVSSSLELFDLRLMYGRIRNMYSKVHQG